MNNLFGVDIAKIISDAFTGELLPVTILRKTEGQYDPVAGTQVPATNETFETEGIVSSFSDELKAMGLVRENHRKIVILARPLGTDPQAGDIITIESETFVITGVPKRDPAGATWTLIGES